MSKLPEARWPGRMGRRNLAGSHLLWHVLCLAAVLSYHTSAARMLHMTTQPEGSCETWRG